MIAWTDVTAWAAAFVALWWAIDWLSMRQEGEALPLRRDPLGMLGKVLSKLARNRSLLLTLVVLWLLGAAIVALQDYVLRLHLGAPAASAPPVFTRGPLVDAIPHLLVRALPESLPRLQPVPLTPVGDALVALLLVIAIVRLNLDPPEQIGEATVRRLRWPAAVLAGYLGIQLALLTAGERLLEGVGSGGMLRRIDMIGLTVVGMVLLPALLAPVVTLLWRLVLEVVGTGAWSFRSVLVAVERTWLSVAGALIIANGLRPIAVAVAPGRYDSAPGVAYLLVAVLLAFVPWALVDRQVSLLAALRESWRLFRARWFEAVIFALRFALLFAVLGALVTVVESQGVGQFAAWYRPLAEVLRGFVVLLQVMTVAGLYVALRDDHAEESVCAGCPVTQPSEPHNDDAGVPPCR